GLGGRLTLLGRRADVNVLLKLASVFLLTSLKEGMPNVLMEAQLMATPIVATETGGTPDTVVDGESAILCPIGDIDGLATGCLKILRDPKRAERMGHAGQRHAVAFSSDMLARHYLDLLGAECGALEKNPEPPGS